MNTTLCPQPCMERHGVEIHRNWWRHTLPWTGTSSTLCQPTVLTTNIPWRESHMERLPSWNFGIARDRHRSMIFICPSPRLGYIAIIAYNCTVPGTSLSRSIACTLRYNPKPVLPSSHCFQLPGHLSRALVSVSPMTISWLLLDRVWRRVRLHNKGI